MDGLNDRFGRGTVGIAAQGFGARVRYEAEPEKSGMDDADRGDTDSPIGAGMERALRKEISARAQRPSILKLDFQDGWRIWGVRFHRVRSVSLT